MWKCTNTHVCELCAVSVKMQCCRIPCTVSVLCVADTTSCLRASPVPSMGVCTHVMGAALAFLFRTGQGR